MSLIIDKEDNNKHITSLYCKDELPTWDEMYNEFYLNQIYSYDPSNPAHQEMDPYWKRPHRKMILAWACNQLNKIIFEDNINKHPQPKYRFTLLSTEVFSGSNISYFWNIPEIYTCKIPSTNQYSIFKTDHTRIDIDELGGVIDLGIIRSVDYPERPTIKSLYNSQNTLKFVLKDIIKYFTIEKNLDSSK